MPLANHSWRYRLYFLYKFFQQPLSIGSITPSSNYLAIKMFKGFNWDKVGTIVELGAGTGVFTKYIYEFKKPQCQTFIFEKDDNMRATLIKQFPSLNFASDAEILNSILEDAGVQDVDCIISGLPFAVFSYENRERIIQAVKDKLRPDGLFIAFQYSLQMKSMLEANFKEVTITWVPLNIPPAFVYTCKN